MLGNCLCVELLLEVLQQRRHSRDVPMGNGTLPSQCRVAVGRPSRLYDRLTLGNDQGETSRSATDGVTYALSPLCGKLLELSKDIVELVLI